MAKRDLLIIVGAKADAYFKEFDKMKSKTQKLEEGLVSLGQVSGIAFAGLALVTGKAVKTFADFEANMRNANTIAKLNEEQFQLMSDEVVELSKVFPQTADTLADGLFQIVSSGIAATDAIMVLEEAARAATAGLTDTETAVTAIAGTLNAYGFEADQAGQVSDILFKTVERGVLRFNDLAQNMGQVNAVAATAGVKLEEVAAGLATMTKSGINASESSTALRSLILSLVKPSESLAQIYEKLGIESGEASLRAVGLQGTLKLLTDEVGTSATALSGLITEKRGFQAAAILAGKGADTFASDLDAMANAAGAAQDAFEEQSKSLRIENEKLKSSIDALFIGIGADLAPAVKVLVRGLNAAVGATDDMNQATGGSLSSILALTTVFAGLTSGLAFATVGVIKFTRAIRASTVATGIFNIALRALPFIAVAAAVILLRDKLIDLGSQIIDVTNEQKTMEASNLGLIAQHREQISKFKKLGDEEVTFAGKTIKASQAVKILEGAIEGITKKEIERINARKKGKQEEKEEEEIAPEESPEIMKAKTNQELLAEIKQEFFEEQIEKRKEQLAQEFALEQMNAEEKEAFVREQNQKELDMQVQQTSARAGILSKGFGNLATLMNTGNKELFAIGKAAAIAGALIDTYASAVSIYAGTLKAFAFLGPAALPLAGAMAATAVVAGLVNVALISATAFQPAQAGAAGGRGGFGDSVPRLTSPREIIVPPAFSEGIRSGDLALTGGGGASNITVNITTGNIYGQGGIIQLSEDVRKAVQQGVLDAGAFQGDTS